MDVFVCRVRFLVVVPHRMRIACDRGARAAMLLPLQRQCALQCMLAGTQRRRLTEWVLSVQNVRGPSTGRVGRLSACQARAALAHTPSIFRWSFFFYYSPVFLPQDPQSPGGRGWVFVHSLRVHCSVHVQFTSSAAALNILVFTCVQFMFSSCSVKSEKK